MPFCSNAWMIMSMSRPPMTIFWTITPNGAVPESRPATSIGEILMPFATFGPPVVTPG